MNVSIVKVPDVRAKSRRNVPMLRVGACALHESLEDEYVLDKTEDCVRICTHSGRAEAKARMRACAGVSSVNAYPSRAQIAPARKRCELRVLSSNESYEPRPCAH